MARGQGAVDTRIEGLGTVLRALNRFGKDANNALKDEARVIADRLMVPSYQRAARAVPVYGEYLAGSVRSRRDRLPAVDIGYKGRRLSGGANSIMLRWPTYAGDSGASFHTFPASKWIDRAKGYKPKAVEAWGDALERVIKDWNRGY